MKRRGINMIMREHNNLRDLIAMMIESDATVRIPKGDTQHGQIDKRKIDLDRIAKDVANKLSLSDIRYLSKSKRPLGAYTFSAVTDNYENVILKIQPEDELHGYRKAQQVISKLPKSVSRHLPIIYKIRTLDEINVTPPYNDLGKPEKLGVIVMERLEELPGNMFDLITKSPMVSNRSLRSLINDRSAFRLVVDRAIEVSKPSIDRSISRSKKNLDVDDERDRLRSMLVSVAYDTAIVNQADEDLTFDILKDSITSKIELWGRGLGINNPNHVFLISQGIISTIRGLLSRRAVPIEPTIEKAGALGGILGIKEFVKALDDLKAMRIFPADVHGNNIMLRPETGELVLSDLGHFS